MGAPWPSGAGKPTVATPGRRPGRRHWAFQPVRPSPPPAGEGSLVGRLAGRRLHPGPARSQGDRPVAGGRPAHADPPRHVRPLGHPADARGGRGVRGRPVARRLRPAGRPPAGLARVRRALGPALARRRPLRRHQGLRLHPGAALSLRLYLSRLRDRRLQRRPAATTGSSSSSSPPISSPRGDRQPTAGRAGVPDGRPPVPARSERDHRRPDRRRHAAACSA